jgi:hypothetical protein
MGVGSRVRYKTPRVRASQSLRKFSRAASSPCALPGCRRDSSGIRSVRAPPNGAFYAEICAGGFCLTLGTCDSPELVVHAYDAAAWRLRRPRRDPNFSDIESLEEAEFLALSTPCHRRGPSPPPVDAALARHRRA